jgi:phosphoribosylaminoimidazole-succinocarboxamide synthase
VQNGEWNREPPPPDLPPDVVRTTSERYLDAFQRLTGMPLDQFRATDP